MLESRFEASHKKALSDKPSFEAIENPPFYNYGVAKVITNGQRAANCQRRWAIPFDSLPLSAELKIKVTLVKIDTEGHDLSVLRGMRKLLASNENLKIMCELSSDSYSIEHLVGYLSTLGFVGESFEDGKWTVLAERLPKQQCNAFFWRPKSHINN
jgi:Methyltransferase FkbM domain